MSPEFRQALANTAVFTGTLAERSQDLTELMVNGAELRRGRPDPSSSRQMPNLGCLFSDAADLNDFLADPAVLRNLQLGLDLNQAFFGPIDALAVEGHAIGFPQYGSTERNDQLWLRVQTLLPPGQPDGQPLPAAPTDAEHPARRRLPERLRHGRGPGPAGRGRASSPIREDQLVPAGDPNVGLADVPGSDGRRRRQRPGRGQRSRRRSPRREGQPPRGAGPGDARAGPGRRSGTRARTASGSSWLDDLLLVGALAFFAGGDRLPLWTRRREHGASAD